MSDATQAGAGLPGLPVLNVAGTWDTVFLGAARAALEAALPQFVVQRRWFGSKARAIRAIRIADTIPILPAATLALIEITYAHGDPETYVLPLAFAAGAPARALSQERPAALIAG